MARAASDTPIETPTPIAIVTSPDVIPIAIALVTPIVARLAVTPDTTTALEIATPAAAR